MKKCSRRNRKYIWNAAPFLLAVCALTGCGKNNETAPQEGPDNGRQETESADGRTGEIQEDAQTEGPGESAGDMQIDFAALQAENPDIFAWLSVPGTEIDCPVLQSSQGDDFYESHDAYGQEDDNGAVYIELANLTSMCDFNTVVHGRTGEDENGPFAELYRFTDPDFFEEHEKLYLYLDGNVLTYEIFAAYERENTSLLRSYDFTYQEGCQQFLNDLYGTRDMTMHLREGWEGITPYHFLITLTTQRQDDADRQYVVLAILIEDAAGTIDRIVVE